MSGKNDRDINALREKLSDIDLKLAELLTQRLETVESIGEYKRVNSLPVTDPAREAEVIGNAVSHCPERFRANVENVMKSVIGEAKRVQRGRLNIYLIGMPDSGKTRIGKRLAKRLSMPLIDTDKYIMQRVGLSIDAIFAELGEEAFRSMETMLLAEVAKAGGRVVATGGGTPLFNDNDRLLKNSGVTVFLNRRLSALLGQSVKNRPLLAGDTEKRITALYNERLPKYLSIADITLDPDAPDAINRLTEQYEKLLPLL